MKRIILVICLFSVAGVSALAADFYSGNKILSLIRKAVQDKNLEIETDYGLMETPEDGYRMHVYAFRKDGTSETQFAVFTEAKGRYDLFDYLVITDHEGVVQKVQVIKYRSEHGGEIASRKWLMQFENYRGGELQYGEDISAISGATLSAGSITRNMPVVVDLLKRKVINR